MGRLKGLLNLLVLAVAAAIVWHEYHQAAARGAAPGAPSRPAAGAGDDPVSGAIAAIKQGAAQVATAAADLVRPAAEVEAPVGAAPAVAPDAPSLPAGAVQGDGSADCPAGFPIKGNASSMIYHRPGTGSYERTVPELCFATDAAAAAAGYRAPRN